MGIVSLLSFACIALCLKGTSEGDPRYTKLAGIILAVAVVISLL